MESTSPVMTKTYFEYLKDPVVCPFSELHLGELIIHQRSLSFFAFDFSVTVDINSAQVFESVYIIHILMNPKFQQ